MYHADVTARLRERRLESDQDFEWLKVLRFYLEVSHAGGTEGGGAATASGYAGSGARE